MSENSSDLGQLVAVHGMSPAHLQRGLFISVLSLAFFLVMMTAYYISQGLVFFLLATAFLVIYIITLIGWVRQRRNRVSFYQKGLEYQDTRLRWDEIRSLNDDGEITTYDERKVQIPKTMNNFGAVLTMIRSHTDLDNSFPPQRIS